MTNDFSKFLKCVEDWASCQKRGAWYEFNDRRFDEFFENGEDRAGKICLQFFEFLEKRPSNAPEWRTQKALRLWWEKAGPNFRAHWQEWRASIKKDYLF